MGSESELSCFQFLIFQIGRSAFDEFLKKYIATFKFQSIDTDTFLEFLKVNVPGIENQIDLKLWTEGTGIPPDAMEPVSRIYTSIVSLANEFKQGRMPREDEVSDWKGQDWELYLENLPKFVEPSQVYMVAISEMKFFYYFIFIFGKFFYSKGPSPKVHVSKGFQTNRLLLCSHYFIFHYACS